MKSGLLLKVCGLAVTGLLASAACARADQGPVAQSASAPLTLSPASAQPDGSPSSPAAIVQSASSPLTLAIMPDTDSVYAPADAPKDDAGVNNGGVNVALDFWYSTDYIFRGIDRSEVGGHEDAPNAQFDASLEFNTGKLPHPFIGVFVNVYNADPVSRFQEIRPYLGLDWTIKPLNIQIGQNTYLYPEREELNTAEAYGKLTFDDSVFFGTDKPVFTPYIYAAYDYDLYNGCYFEVGLSHEFVFEDYGLTVTPIGQISYVTTNQLFATTPGGNDSGFQHYDLGFTMAYSLNRLFNVPDRFGEWNMQGEFFYTSNIKDNLRGDNETYGGIGIGFKY